MQTPLANWAVKVLGLECRRAERRVREILPRVAPSTPPRCTPLVAGFLWLRSPLNILVQKIREPVSGMTVCDKVPLKNDHTTLEPRLHVLTPCTIAVCYSSPEVEVEEFKAEADAMLSIPEQSASPVSALVSPSIVESGATFLAGAGEARSRPFDRSINGLGTIPQTCVFIPKLFPPLLLPRGPPFMSTPISPGYLYLTTDPAFSCCSCEGVAVTSEEVPFPFSTPFPDIPPIGSFSPGHHQAFRSKDPSYSSDLFPLLCNLDILNLEAPHVLEHELVLQVPKRACLHRLISLLSSGDIPPGMPAQSVQQGH
ncbi:hypothetical protein K488DRAFT_72778 [Vararia minispora EC-137]|uniref:Uncharacterized protein n=1 Tax=Vararia minispora EC-137 TaxID=1314806 RepID=A0ACB8QD57_9AGAM|nr:hypothetical protein K488DRAFT_72778 [Vararia minispora EC-137]